ncbi:MAG: peptide-methionine (S)-S-oxide reductase MsrA [Acidimicrobiales bacterium]
MVRWLDRSQHLTVPTPDQTLPGRSEAIVVPNEHYVTGVAILPPFPDHSETIYFAMGCFWGAERLFWAQPGVITTAVGYMGGTTPNPTYEETCTAMTGHTESDMVVYAPTGVSLDQLYKVFWENHDPTQYMGQGNDIGTQYRTAIYTTTDAQYEAAVASRKAYQNALNSGGYGTITTEIAPAGLFYYAEPYHQQYLAKNPYGYCNHGFCQVDYRPSPAPERAAPASPEG